MFTSSPASGDYTHPIWERSNFNRLKAIKEYFNRHRIVPGATVLDLGAGPGFFCRELADLGYACTAVESRKVLHDTSPGFRIVHADLEDSETFARIVESYDVTLVLGLLYHLADPGRLLRGACEKSRHVLVDSVVLDHDGIAIVSLQEDPTIVGNSVRGIGNRPSPKWITNQMAESGFVHVEDLSSSELDIRGTTDSTGHLYSWEYQRTCGWRRDEMQLRKFLAYRRA